MSHIRPMKAKAARTVPADPHSERVVEIKYDGWRCLAHRTADGVDLRTGSGKAIVGPEYIMEALMCLPVGTILDGEMVGKPGAEWNQAQSVCSRQRRHIVCPASPALTFHVFDVLAVAGEDRKRWAYRERHAVVESLVEEVGDVNVVAAQQFPCTEESMLDILASGFEGGVVKRLFDPYVEDDRGIWLKVKPFEEIEAVCTGFFAGQGRLAGGAGGITFRVTHEDGTVYDGQCKGKMSETWLQEAWTDQDRYIGRVVEIIHWGINDGGALRHPNFRRFRDPADKATPSVQAPAARPKPEAPTQSKGRNYGSMGDEKLLVSMIAIEAGNGKPNDDRDRCLAEVTKRGLV